MKFDRRRFLGTALATLPVALRPFVSGRDVPPPEVLPDPQRAPNTILFWWNSDVKGPVVRPELGLLCDNLHIHLTGPTRKEPRNGPTQGTGSCQRLIGPLPIMKRFFEDCGSVIKPATILLGLTDTSKQTDKCIAWVICKHSVLTVIGPSVQTQDMMVTGTDPCYPGMQFIFHGDPLVYTPGDDMYRLLSKSGSIIPQELLTLET